MKKRHVLIPLGAGALACAAIALSFRASQSPDDLAGLASDTRSSPAETSSAVADQGTTSVVTGSSGTQPAAAASIELDPNVNYMTLGEAAFAQRDWPASVENLRRACVQKPSSFRAHYLFGLALRYVGRNEESNAAFDRALEIAPHDVRAQINSARTLLELQRPEEAEARVRAALESEPSNAEAWNVLGRALLARERLAEAESALQQACELDSNQAYARNNLGLARLQRGAWAEAANALEDAVRLRDDVAYFHNNLGLAYERLGRGEDAAREYTRALELQPEYVKAQVSLARLMAREPGLAQRAMSDSTRSAAADSSAPTSGERGSEAELSVKP